MTDDALEGRSNELPLRERLDEVIRKLDGIETRAAASKTDWYKRVLDTVQMIVVVVGVTVALQQLIQLRKNSSQTAYDTVSKEWLQLDRHFVTNHQLRPYFFDGKAIDRNHPDYPLVDATAHHVLNFLDYAIDTADHLGPQMSGSFVETTLWHRYIQRTYFSSPIICDNLKKYGDGYSDATWQIAKGACGLPERAIQKRCDGWWDATFCWLGLR
jgi:hypothetical protein